MPARITVSVLSELLGRSQALTDANREKLLEREAEQRIREKALAAKKAKQEDERRRRRAQDDPTGRNIFTAPAAVGSAPLACMWLRQEVDASPPGEFTGRLYIAPGDGQEPVLTPVALTGAPTFSITTAPESGTIIRRIRGSVLASEYFPTGQDDLILWVGVGATYEQVDDVGTFGIVIPVSYSFTVLSSAAYLVSTTDATPVALPAGLSDAIMYQYRGDPSSNGYDMTGTKSTAYIGPSPVGFPDGIGDLRTPSVFATFDGIAAGIFAGGVPQDSTLVSLAAIIGAYPGNIPNQHAGESLTRPRLQTVPGITAPTDPGFDPLFTTHLNQRAFCQAKSGYPLPPAP